MCQAGVFEQRLGVQSCRAAGRVKDVCECGVSIGEGIHTAQVHGTYASSLVSCAVTELYIEENVE